MRRVYIIPLLYYLLTLIGLKLDLFTQLLSNLEETYSDTVNTRSFWNTHIIYIPFGGAENTSNTLLDMIVVLTYSAPKHVKCQFQYFIIQCVKQCTSGRVVIRTVSPFSAQIHVAQMSLPLFTDRVSKCLSYCTNLILNNETMHVLILYRETAVQQSKARTTINRLLYHWYSWKTDTFTSSRT